MEFQLQDHQDLLRTMYITQNQTLVAVMDYMNKHHQIIPEFVPTSESTTLLTNVKGVRLLAIVQKMEHAEK